MFCDILRYMVARENKNRIIFFAYYLLLGFLVIFSWGFVDKTMPIPTLDVLYSFIHEMRDKATIVYIGLSVGLFVFYGYFLTLAIRKYLTVYEVKRLIIISSVLLFFSFPGLSYDVFNYIATAKVTYFYKENPYVVMPIEITNEPMLAFMHASNKVALYGPTWILLTVLPYILGNGQLLLTVFAMKLFVLLFYILTLVLLWKLSEKSTWAVIFFGLNPLVLLDILVSAHNDIAMMALALGAFYALKKQHIGISIVLFIFSIFVKYATGILVPVYVYCLWMQIGRKNIHWETIWKSAAYLLFIIFLLSPFREEIYSWYFIWPLTFVALLPRTSLETAVSIGFTFGLMQRITPFILTREWGGNTPLVKKIVTFSFPALSSVYYAIKSKY